MDGLIGPTTRINWRRRRRRGPVVPPAVDPDCDITFVLVDDFVADTMGIRSATRPARSSAILATSLPMVYRSARPDHHRRPLPKFRPVAREPQGAGYRPRCARDNVELAAGIRRVKAVRGRNKPVM